MAGPLARTIASSLLAHLAAEGNLDTGLLTFFKNSMLGTGPTLLTRSSTIVGQEIPLSTRFSTTASANPLWIYLDYDLRLNDDPAVVRRNHFSCNIGSSVSLDADHLQPQPPGEHTLRGIYRFHVYAGRDNDFVGSRWLFMVERTATAKVRILPGTVEAIQLLRDQPDVASTIQSNARICLSFTASTHLLGGTIDLGTPSVPIISSIIIEANGKRTSAGTLWGVDGRRHEISLYMPACPDKVKLILAPNVNSALRTTNIASILANPITFEAVPVKQQP